MKTLVFVVLLVVLMTSAISAYDWVTNPSNGHRYTLVDGDTWTDAESMAITLGGHLVTIRSQAENDWVFNMTLSFSGFNTYRAWIGLYQPPNTLEPNGGWLWSSGEPIVYTNWQTTTGEPNDYYGNSAPEDWVQIYIRQHDWDEIPSFWNDTWNDRPNTSDVGIVEIIPEPSSFLLPCGGIIGLFAFRRRRT